MREPAAGMTAATGTLGEQSQAAGADALERALARHLAARGPVRDEHTMRAVVAAALRRALRASLHDAGRRPPAPAGAPAEDPVAAALRLDGDAPVRAGAAQLVRLYFQALVDTGRRDPSIVVEELVDAFVAGVWRGLSQRPAAEPAGSTFVR